MGTDGTRDTRDAQQPEQQEQPATRKRLILRVFAYVMATCGVLVALDLLLCHLLIPYGSEAEAIWYQYYRLKDEPIDTLICGSSFAMQCIDPELIDETLGSSTCSLATAGQSRASTLIALKDAYEDHHIKRAIVGVSIESMNKTETRLEYNLAFAHGEMQGRSLGHAADTYLRTLLDHQYFTTTSSLAIMMPWTVWHVGYTPDDVQINLERRRSMTPVEVQQNFNRQKITERGYAPVPGTKTNNTIAQYAVSAADSEYEVDERVLDEYRSICRYCAQHDIKLYFVTIPWIDYLLARYERPGGYNLAIKPFVDAMEAEGATFLDCALFKREHYHVGGYEYYNEQHLNREGAQRFTPYLAELIARSERGEDLSDVLHAHSMEGWKEYLGTLEGILLSTFTATPVDGAINLQMKSWTAPDVEVEYAVFRVREEGGYEQLCDYSTADTFSYPIEGHGEIKLRINARRAGSKKRCERYCIKRVYY